MWRTTQLLLDDDWTRIWKPIRETMSIVMGGPRGDVNADPPREVNWHKLEWKQVGRQYPGLKSAMKEASDLHNFLL
jgi:hypothetical protein